MGAHRPMLHCRRIDWYRYQLVSDYAQETGIMGRGCAVPFVWLYDDGRLELAAGYCWDGASGPAINTRDFVRGSLVHDALYQCYRERGFDETLRKKADALLRRICMEDGMGRIRAWWVYTAVRHFGGAYARCAPKKADEIIIEGGEDLRNY